MPTQSSYGAAKEAIRSLSKTAAIEWGPQGVRVNVICPFANSPGVAIWSQHFPEAAAAQIAKVPLRRIGEAAATDEDETPFDLRHAARSPVPCLEPFPFALAHGNDASSCSYEPRHPTR